MGQFIYGGKRHTTKVKFVPIEYVHLSFHQTVYGFCICKKIVLTRQQSFIRSMELSSFLSLEQQHLMPYYFLTLIRCLSQKRRQLHRLVERLQSRQFFFLTTVEATSSLVKRWMYIIDRNVFDFLLCILPQSVRFMRVCRGI